MGAYDFFGNGVLPRIEIMPGITKGSQSAPKGITKAVGFYKPVTLVMGY